MTLAVEESDLRCRTGIAFGVDFQRMIYNKDTIL